MFQKPPQALLFQLLLLLLQLLLLPPPLLKRLLQALSLQPLPPPNPPEVPLVAIQRCPRALLVQLPVRALHPITFMPFNWTSSRQWMTRLNCELVNWLESSMSTMTAG